MDIGKQIRIAHELGRRIAEGANKADKLGSGYEHESIIISAYSNMSIPEIIKAKSGIKRQCHIIRLLLRDGCYKPSNPSEMDKQLIERYTKLSQQERIKALADLEKIIYIIGVVIKKKRERERIKNNAGVIDRLADAIVD